MVLNGELNIDDPVQSLLPKGVQAPTRNGEEIKLYQLSNHTSSLPRMPDNMDPEDPDNPDADYTEDQLYAFLEGVELTRLFCFCLCGECSDSVKSRLTYYPNRTHLFCR